MNCAPMGRFIDKNHGFAIYNAPKGGGTTIRSWIYFAKTGELALKDEGEGYINQTKKPANYSERPDMKFAILSHGQKDLQFA